MTPACPLRDPPRIGKCALFQKDGLPVGRGVSDDHRDRVPTGVPSAVRDAARDPQHRTCLQREPLVAKTMLAPPAEQEDDFLAVRVVVERVRVVRVDVDDAEGHLGVRVNLLIAEPSDASPREVGSVRGLRRRDGRAHRVARPFVPVLGRSSRRKEHVEPFAVSFRAGGRLADEVPRQREMPFETADPHDELVVEDGKVNVTLRPRQPGSAIKPLNYALALETGKITPSTPLADVPTCFSVVGQRLYYL